MLCTCVNTPTSRMIDVESWENKPQNIDRPADNCMKYTTIKVRSPVLVCDCDGERYTNYEIQTETNDIAFSLPKTSVRRRFSEFDWLLKVLNGNHSVEPPCLPSKNWFSMAGRFDPEVIETRREKLEHLINELVCEPQYLSDPSLHLFLQTSLSVREIEEIAQGRSQTSVLDTIIKEEQKYNTAEHYNKMSVDRTKTGTFHSDRASPCSTLTDEREMPVVIHLPDDVTQRVFGDSSDEADSSRTSLFSGDTSACELCQSAGASLRPSTSLSSSDSDYLSSSPGAGKARKQQRKVSFYTEPSIEELLQRLGAE